MSLQCKQIQTLQTLKRALPAYGGARFYMDFTISTLHRLYKKQIFC